MDNRKKLEAIARVLREMLPREKAPYIGITLGVCDDEPLRLLAELGCVVETSVYPDGRAIDSRSLQIDGVTFSAQADYRAATPDEMAERAARQRPASVEAAS